MPLALNGTVLTMILEVSVPAGQCVATSKVSAVNWGAGLGPLDRPLTAQQR